MKTKVLIISFILGVLFSMKMYAQAPSYSTPEEPIWQYIQVVGSAGSVANRVLTAEDGKVYGRPIYLGLEPSLIDKQLWRIELATKTTVMFVNKATGKKMDVAYGDLETSPNNKFRMAILSDNPSTDWKFKVDKGNYNIIMVKEPTEGTKGNTIAFQSTAFYRGYIIMFESQSRQSEDNAYFQFFNFNANRPQPSVNGNDVWYFIKSLRPEMADQCITAITNPTDPAIKFTIAPKGTGNDNQYWKFVKVNDDADDIRYFIQNKGTGDVISTKVILDRYFYVQNANDLHSELGWEIKIINEEQFEIQGMDGKVIRYLNATASGERSDTYVAGKSKDTGFAWTFEWIEGKVSLVNPEMGEVKVYSENKRIYVEGTDNYTVRDIYGSPVRKNETLPIGIYLVTINGETTKILVK